VETKQIDAQTNLHINAQPASINVRRFSRTELSTMLYRSSSKSLFAWKWQNS
jgi:hypothetical protein